MDRSDSTHRDDHTPAVPAARSWRSVWLHRARRPAQMVLWCVLALHLAACSRTVEWQEEVPLNTGETIWVKREADYEISGDAGNPLNIGMYPTGVQEIRFEYAGRTYTYRSRINLILLAISPQGVPNLIAPAGDYSWAKDWNHRYSCTVPFYVQLIPGPDGKTWTWPKTPEPWLYGMPANLMVHHPRPGEPWKRKYTRSDRDERDTSSRASIPSGARIDPLYKSDNCITYPEEK
jgi:hypothetical protein